MELIERFKEQARSDPRRIVLPESDDDRIVQAAAQAAAEGIAQPILLGEPSEVQQRASHLKVKLDEVSIVDPASFPELDSYVAAYCQRREIEERVARRLISKRILIFGAMMVSMGGAEGMVAGAAHATARVLEAGGLAIGLADGVCIPSSFFIMVFPECLGEKDKVLIFADAAVNVDPTPEQLADIAISSGRSAQRLLDLEPKIALLSYSTKRSGKGPSVDTVVEATQIAQQKAPDLAIDGELQADAALVSAVAQKKVKESPVAGQANVLVFPDLNAGNIGYKLTQHLTGAKAYGPVLQGFSQPINDLSRGATVEEIAGMIAITVVQAQKGIS